MACLLSDRKGLWWPVDLPISELRRFPIKSGFLNRPKSQPDVYHTVSTPE